MISSFFTQIFEFLAFNHLFSAVALFIFGLLFGSFFNVVLYRWPLKEKNNNILMINDYLDEIKIEKSEQLRVEAEKINNTSLNLSFPASHCPKCATPLRWYHNIPLFSYIFLKGKCAFCKTPISAQYPVVELSTALVFVGAFLLNPFTGTNFVFSYVFFILTWLILLIDYKSYTIPDNLNYSLLWLGLLASAVAVSPQTPVNAIIGAAVGYITLWVISRIGKLWKGVDAMGEGDLKLLAGIGAFLGASSIFFIILSSTFIGIFTWIIFKFVHKDEQTEANNALPYGPALVLASWLYVFYGQAFMTQILKV